MMQWMSPEKIGKVDKVCGKETTMQAWSIDITYIPMKHDFSLDN